jgi:hypothetical protein
MGDKVNGFLTLLQDHLDHYTGTDWDVLRDEKDLEEGRYFDHQLAKLIDRSSVLLILYSHNWLASEWCWKEFDHAVSRLPDLVLVPIVFQPFEYDRAKVFKGRDAMARRLHAEVLRIQGDDLASGCFVPDLRNAYGESDGRHTRMSVFAQRYQKKITNALGNPQQTLWQGGERGLGLASSAGVGTGSAGVQSAISPLQLSINGRAVDFVHIPAGSFVCAETRQTHRVDKPFLIMKRSTPADQLLPSSDASGLTFGDLLAPGLRTGTDANMRSITLSLPTEDQWDWAMHFAGHAGTPDRAVYGGLAGAADILPPSAAQKEPVSAVAVPRRAFAELTGPMRRKLGWKWVEAEQLRRQTPLREDRKLGHTRLRLVAPVSAARIKER